jgi:hypothetical protein
VSNAEEAPVARLLADELKRQQVGKRELARILAGSDADHTRIEKERRAIYKVLDGRQPKPPFARRLARALSLPDDYFVREVKRTSAAERIAALERELEEVRAENLRLRRRKRP